MAVLTQTTEVTEKRAEEKRGDAAVQLVSPSCFKYYIHDSVATLRFQLIGDLRTPDVTELNGSWETARPTLALRSLVLDLRQLASADEHAERWLLKMKDSGAVFLPADYFALGVRPASPCIPAAGVKLSLMDRISAIVKRAIVKSAIVKLRP